MVSSHRWEEPACATYSAAADIIQRHPRRKELVNRKIYHTRRKAIKEVTSWIELCYNQTRLHSAIGYRTPNEVHQEWGKTKTAA